MDFILVFDDKHWRVTRIVEAVVRDEVFNFGFSIPGDPFKKALGFINGVNVQTMAFAAQIPTQDPTHSSITRGDLILGSKFRGKSATGAEIGDLVYWMRYTSKNEGHRFIGYTSNLLFLSLELHELLNDQLTVITRFQDPKSDCLPNQILTGRLISLCSTMLHVESPLKENGME